MNTPDDVYGTPECIVIRPLVDSKTHYRRLGRELAMQFLYQVDISGELYQSEQQELFWKQADDSDEFPKNRIYRRAKVFAQGLIDGYLNNKDVIDQTISLSAKKWKMERIAAVDRNILRVSTYEILFMPQDVPPPVSINEAVEISKGFADEDSAKFVNGILDHICNNPPDIAKANLEIAKLKAEKKTQLGKNETTKKTKSNVKLDQTEAIPLNEELVTDYSDELNLNSEFQNQENIELSEENTSILTSPDDSGKCDDGEISSHSIVPRKIAKKSVDTNGFNSVFKAPKEEGQISKKRVPRNNFSYEGEGPVDGVPEEKTAHNMFKSRDRFGRKVHSDDKPFGDRPRSGFGRRERSDDKPFGDRPRSGFGRRERSDDRPFGDRPRGGFGRRDRTDDKPFGDRPRSGFGRRDRTEDKPFGDRPRSGFGRRDRTEDKPFGDRPRSGFGRRDRTEDKSFGDRPRSGFGRRERSDDKPFGDRPRSGFGRRERSDDKPFGDRPRSGFGRRERSDDKPFGDRPRSGFGRRDRSEDKPFGDRPREFRGRDSYKSDGVRSDSSKKVFKFSKRKNKDD